MENMEAVYNSRIRPKLEELRAICNESGVPFLAAFGIQMDEEGQFNFRSASLLPEMLGIDAPNDRMFSSFVNVINGFKTVPPSQMESLDAALLELPEGFSIEVPSEA